MKVINFIKQTSHTLKKAEQQGFIFFGHGTDNAWDEAVALLAFVLKQRTVHSNQQNLKLTDTQIQQAGQLIQRRINERKPLPYLTQQAWFAELDFVVDERVIIPRSPLAEWIMQERGDFASIGFEPEKVLDLCCGSACIGLSIAYHWQGVKEVVVSDICEKALELAEVNVGKLQKKEQIQSVIRVVKSDVFNNLKTDLSTFDMIVANPPYVPLSSFKHLPAEYQHEPKKALVSQRGGLECAQTIVAQARAFLTPKGKLIIEVGEVLEEFIAWLNQAHPQTSFVELLFENGGEGVLMFEAKDLPQTTKSE